jgi:hypothetical protein
MLASLAMLAIFCTALGWAWGRASAADLLLLARTRVPTVAELLNDGGRREWVTLTPQRFADMAARQAELEDEIAKLRELLRRERMGTQPALRVVH